MSKDRISATVDEDVAEYLDQDHINTSGLVNRLLKQYISGGRTDEQIREFRKQQVKSEYKDAANRARRKLQEFNELRAADAEPDTLPDDERAEWFEKVRMVPRDTDHPLVQDAADALGMDAAAVVREAYE